MIARQLAWQCRNINKLVPRLRRTISGTNLKDNNQPLAPRDMSDLGSMSQNYLQEKLESLEAAQPDLDKFAFFNFDKMSELPWFLDFLEPVISKGKVEKEV